MYGFYESEGILQVRCNNSQQWNGICGNNWRSSVHAHQRACHKLGFIDTAHGSPYVIPSLYVSTSLNILVEDIFCTGEEEDILQCRFQHPYAFDFCSNYAGLECSSEGKKFKWYLF